MGTQHWGVHTNFSIRVLQLKQQDWTQLTLLDRNAHLMTITSDRGSETATTHGLMFVKQLAAHSQS